MTKIAYSERLALEGQGIQTCMIAIPASSLQKNSKNYV